VKVLASQKGDQTGFPGKVIAEERLAKKSIAKSACKKTILESMLS
jgi:hypothetical protein